MTKNTHSTPDAQPIVPGDNGLFSAGQFSTVNGETKAGLLNAARMGWTAPSAASEMGVVLRSFLDRDGPAYDATFAATLDQVRPNWLSLENTVAGMGRPILLTDPGVVTDKASPVGSWRERALAAGKDFLAPKP